MVIGIVIYCFSVWEIFYRRLYINGELTTITFIFSYRIQKIAFMEGKLELPHVSLPHSLKHTHIELHQHSIYFSPKYAYKSIMTLFKCVSINRKFHHWNKISRTVYPLELQPTPDYHFHQGNNILRFCRSPVEVTKVKKKEKSKTKISVQLMCLPSGNFRCGNILYSCWMWDHWRVHIL